MSMFTVRGSLIWAGGIIAAALAIAGLQLAEVISDDLSGRLMGAILGFVLIACGNEIPKAIAPITGVQAPARKQALQRFSGWTFVIAGIGYMVAWIVLPINYAAWGAVACGLTGLLVVVLRCMMARTVA